MASDNIISKEIALKASLQPLESVYRKKQEKIYAPYFIEEVRRNIINKYGETSLYREGLNVITTIDPKLQEMAINALRTGLENYDKRHGWKGPIDNLGKVFLLDKPFKLISLLNYLDSINNTEVIHNSNKYLIDHIIFSQSKKTIFNLETHCTEH